jgi:hypothetical protein
MNVHITRQVGYHAISLVEMEVVLYLEIMTSSMGVFSTDMHLLHIGWFAVYNKSVFVCVCVYA